MTARPSSPLRRAWRLSGLGLLLRAGRRGAALRPRARRRRGMRHRFSNPSPNALADRSVATLRYQFPYMERRASRPDPPRWPQRRCPSRCGGGAPRRAGCPSSRAASRFGGRIDSGARRKRRSPACGARVCLGFPLHPPGRPGDKRAEHLAQVRIPICFSGRPGRVRRPEVLKPVVNGSARGPRCTW